MPLEEISAVLPSKDYCPIVVRQFLDCLSFLVGVVKVLFKVFSSLGNGGDDSHQAFQFES